MSGHHKSFCKHGHVMDAANTRVVVNHKGYTCHECRACNRNNTARYASKHPEKIKGALRKYRQSPRGSVRTKQSKAAYRASARGKQLQRRWQERRTERYRIDRTERDRRLNVVNKGRFIRIMGTSDIARKIIAAHVQRIAVKRLIKEKMNENVG